MPSGIKFTSKTKMVVALKTDQSIADVEAQLEVAESMKKDHGDCYYVFDYTTRDGENVPWALMHQNVFDQSFEFTSTEYDRKFVPVKTITTPTH